MAWLWSLVLLLLPATHFADRLLDTPLLTFASGAAAIVPLAEWMRRGTEQLAARACSAIGGLLNVTFGNAAGLVSLALRLRDRRRQCALRRGFCLAVCVVHAASQ